MSRSSLSGWPLSGLRAVLAAVLLSLPLATRAVGLEPYAPAEGYAAGMVVIGADGNTYRAIHDAKGIDPATAGGGAWRLAHAANDLVIDVPGRFKTIGEAWKFLAGARIDESAKVTIELAPGELAHDAPLVLNHTEGARIVLRGAGDKPEECRLVFNGPEGIVVDHGHVITIENFTIKSTRGDGGVPGLLVRGRSSATASACRFDNCSAMADGNADLDARKCEFTLARQGDAVSVRNGSSARLVDCVAVAKRKTKDKGWIGFSAYNGSDLTCVGCRAEGWRVGFQAYCNGALHLDTCVGRDNGIGASCEYASSMNVIDCEYSQNEWAGVASVNGATAAIIGCQLVNNGWPNFALGNAILNFIDKPSTIARCRVGVEAKAGGRIDLTKAVFKDVVKQLNVGNGPGDLPIEQAFTNAP